MFGDHLKEDDELNSLQQLHRENPKMWSQALHEWGYLDAVTSVGLAYRKPSAIPEQETLYTEFGISAGSRRTISQVVHPYDHRQVVDRTFELAIQRLPAGPAIDHLHRIVDRAEAEEHVSQWQLTQEISRDWHIPAARLAEQISEWIKDGTWVIRYHPDDAFDYGIMTPEVRPVDAAQAVEQLNDLAVSIDRTRLEMEHGDLVDGARKRAVSEASKHLPLSAHRSKRAYVRRKVEMNGQLSF